MPSGVSWYSMTWSTPKPHQIGPRLTGREVQDVDGVWVFSSQLHGVVIENVFRSVSGINSVSYTGKADRVRRPEVGEDDVVVFVHGIGTLNHAP